MYKKPCEELWSTQSKWRFQRDKRGGGGHRDLFPSGDVIGRMSQRYS